MPNVMAALPNIDGASVERRKVWLTPTTRVPCSNAAKTRNRQVRAISTRRDSSNLVADRFRPYSITLSSSLAGRRPVRELSQAGQRNGIWL